MKEVVLAVAYTVLRFGRPHDSYLGRLKPSEECAFIIIRDLTARLSIRVSQLVTESHLV